MNPIMIDDLLAALRTRQDARYAYERARWKCIEHGAPLPAEWAERRRELFDEWRRAVGRHCAVYKRVMREIGR